MVFKSWMCWRNSWRSTWWSTTASLLSKLHLIHAEALAPHDITLRFGIKAMNPSRSIEAQNVRALQVLCFTCGVCPSNMQELMAVQASSHAATEKLFQPPEELQTRKILPQFYFFNFWTRMLKSYITTWSLLQSPGPEQGSHEAFQEAPQRSVIFSKKVKAPRLPALDNMLSRKISIWVRKYYIFSQIKCSFWTGLKMPIMAPQSTFPKSQGWGPSPIPTN